MGFYIIFCFVLSDLKKKKIELIADHHVSVEPANSINILPNSSLAEEEEGLGSGFLAGPIALKTDSVNAVLRAGALEDVMGFMGSSS